MAAAGNFTIAFISVCLGLEQRQSAGSPERRTCPLLQQTKPHRAPAQCAGGMIKWILFSTGFMAMAMEVVWTRAFIPVLKTQVYSFAMIVFTYLGATFVGSWMYRRDLRKKFPCRREN